MTGVQTCALPIFIAQKDDAGKIKMDVFRYQKDFFKNVIIAGINGTDTYIQKKMLMNFSYDSLNCFTLILSGESYFNDTLKKSIHDALRQRITVHYDFQGLDPDEVAAYIRHKLSLAGGSDAIIGADALSALTGYCSGNARVIDNVMTDALTLGAQLGRSVIDSDVILAAVNEQTL